MASTSSRVFVLMVGEVIALFGKLSVDPPVLRSTECARMRGHYVTRDKRAHEAGRVIECKGAKTQRRNEDNLQRHSPNCVFVSVRLCASPFRSSLTYNQEAHTPRATRLHG